MNIYQYSLVTRSGADAEGQYKCTYKLIDPVPCRRRSAAQKRAPPFLGSAPRTKIPYPAARYQVLPLASEADWYLFSSPSIKYNRRLGEILSRFPVGSTISFYYFTTDLQSTRQEKVLPYSGACDVINIPAPFCSLLYTSAGPITSAPMMDGVDLDVSQARADLLPDKYDRRRISGVLAIRRLSSRPSLQEADERGGRV